MSISTQSFWLAVAATFAGATLPAHADLAIAKRPTKNVSCTGGSCVATAAHAVMNAADLRHLLAAQPAVSLDAGPAKNIVVDTALTWTSGAALSLTATGALSVNQPVTVASKAAVTINSASMVFAPKASLTFWDTTSVRPGSLTINGKAYVLLRDVDSWSNLNLWGLYAFANDCDAAKVDFLRMDVFSGAIEGLGHTISNIVNDGGVGLIGSNTGRISNIHFENVQSRGAAQYDGLIAGGNYGVIDHVSATGSIPNSGFAGGLVGFNGGTISNSHANATIQGGAVGGLVGATNGGTIDSSYAEGSVGDPELGHGIFAAGGLVGVVWGPDPEHAAHLTNSYSVAKVAADHNGAHLGGLIGKAEDFAMIDNSYAAGKIVHTSGTLRGGVIGDDGRGAAVPKTSFADTYWDFDNGVNKPARGAGNVPNVPGVVGLTDAQLKSGLPAGFDPKIWARDASINHGYPYLRSNPPQ